jgi:hypothetical protein
MESPRSRILRFTVALALACALVGGACYAILTRTSRPRAAVIIAAFIVFLPIRILIGWSRIVDTTNRGGSRRRSGGESRANPARGEFSDGAKH